MTEENISWAIKTTDGGTTIRRTEADGTVWSVPEAPGNRHYEEYLVWVAEGNEPEVIEEP